MRTWKKGSDSDDWNAKDREFYGDESEQGEVDAWGLATSSSAETGGEGLYRPPHLVALGDKAKEQVVVW